MKRRSPTTWVSPFLSWSEWARKVGELYVASAQVIAHRTARPPTPGAW
jgi:hypothetical protein